MRLVLAMVLAVLVAFPLSASAQEAGEGATSEPNVVQESAPEEPALQLKLDEAGVGVVPPPPRTPDGYTLEEMELRVKRAKIGLGVSAGSWALGFALMIPGATGECSHGNPPERCQRLRTTSGTFTFVGLVGMITSGILLARRKRDRDWLRQAQYGRPRRVQWAPVQSQLVF